MTTYELSFTPTFLNEAFDLPRHVTKQLSRKVELLREDPISARGDAKKLAGKGLYRVRIGDYRIVYMLGRGWVKLLSVRKRNERTYEDEVLGDEEPASLPDPALQEVPRIPTPEVATHPAPEVVTGSDMPPPAPMALEEAIVLPPPPSPAPQPVPELLPYRLSEEMLERWLIPREHWPAALSIATTDELLSIQIPKEFAERILDNLFARPIEEIAAQPEYVLQEPEDLERYIAGDLSAFLLRLDPGQEALRDWGGGGPTLVRGGPGTGKSTLAIYRAQRLVDRGETPILFTTYTNALVRYSEQLLAYLLGAPAKQRDVHVSTVDSLATQYFARAHGEPVYATDGQIERHLERALADAPMPGANEFDRRVRRQHLERLGLDYLRDEILTVTVPWGLRSAAEYLSVERRGRGIPLRAPQREALWAVYERWRDSMTTERLVTHELIRAGALEVAQGLTDKPFRALIVDEAQDLSPVALRFLLALCSTTEIYLAADTSQSIYQRGFSWQQVHADLRVRGRTLMLRRNYRNTAQIAAACTAILTGTGAGDEEALTQEPSPYSGDLPTVLLAEDQVAQVEAIRTFFTDAARRWRLPIHSGAVLCRNQYLGRTIARRLSEQGVEARFLQPREIDITAPIVKVLTLHAAKGLEFPFVVVADVDDGVLPRRLDDLPAEEAASIVDEERRLFFVGCSRAMRALLVCGARTAPSPFLEPLRPPLWDRMSQATAQGRHEEHWEEETS